MPIYTIRVFKAWGSRDSAMRWVNNYEVQSAGVSPTDLIATANGIVAAERTIHRSVVQFLSATISTFLPDSKPYNPSTFTTIALSGAGNVPDPAGTGLDINVAYWVKFATALGRNGKRFYRGVLAEADVETSGNLRWIITPTSGYADIAGGRFADFRTAISPFLLAGANSDKIILAGANAEGVERVVTGVVPGGVVVNKHDHRYFDRAGPR